MKKNNIMLIISLFGISSYAMDSNHEQFSADEIDQVIGQVGEIKKRQYEQKLRKELKPILEFPFSDALEVDRELRFGKNGCFYKLYAEEEYAPLLELMLKSKKLNPNASWQCKYNYVQHGHFTLLTSALFLKAYRNAFTLLGHGANPNVVGTDPDYSRNLRPLAIAKEQNNSDLIGKLLAAGAYE